nr:polysaccharide lyase family 8 super-sandwich domain-containing protein [uncultured Actinotalea sp.]
MRAFVRQGRWRGAVLACALLLTGAVTVSAPTTAAAVEDDPFAAVRERWVASIVGDGTADLADPVVRSRVEKITADARARWATMDTAADRTAVFAAHPAPVPNQNITQTYLGLKELAVAYRTPGSELSGDPQLRDDVLGALEWLHEHWYNAEIPFAPQTPDNNWFAWELGVPLALVDVLALMYEDLSPEQVQENLAAIDHFLPRPDKLGRSVGWNLASEGANLAWASTSIGKRGILGGDGAKVELATSALSPLFEYAELGGNGFYRDGSVLFHEGFPYTTGYGWSNVVDPTVAVVLYEGSPWAITDPDKDNLVQWVKDSFVPFVWRNRIPDSLAGRNIARPPGQDRATGLVRIALDQQHFASAEDRILLRSLVKYLLTSDPDSTFFSSATLPQIIAAREILDDDAVEPFDPGSTYTQFPAMDRSVAQRPDFAFGVAAFSSRTQNYESINNENVRGWHTADGRTTLYTSDLDQYGSGYWATVDSTRIPGTTVAAHVTDDVVAPQLGRLVLQGPTSVTEEFDDLDGVFYRTPRWQLDTSDPQVFGGDASRLRRTENSQETITLRLDTGITGFELAVHHTQLSDLSRLRVMSSPNNSSYAPVRLTTTTTGRTDGWSHVTVTPAAPLPAGTTYLRVHLMPSVPQSFGTQDWVGGVELDGTFGATGMQLATPEQSLTATKSWFVLDDEVVAVGSGISSGEGRAVETVVENRRLTDRFPGRLTVDGQDLGADDGVRDLPGARWAAFHGGVEGSDLGYVFPEGADLTAEHESRAGTWEGIGNSRGAVANRFASLGIGHGVDPTEAGYSYVLLPGRGPDATARYAAEPQAQVLAATAQVHAVREASLGVVAANVWQDAPTSVQVDGEDFLTVSERAAVMTREDVDGLTVAVSDPTQGAGYAGDLVDEALSFAQVYEHSPNWGFETGGGFKRTKASVEYLTYEVEEAADFTVSLGWNHLPSVGNTSPVLDRVKFHASPDNATWTPVEARFVEPYTPVNGWAIDNVADVTNVEPLPAGTRYVKIEVLDNDRRAFWSPQVRRVEIDSSAPDGDQVVVEVSRSAVGVLEEDPRVEVLSLDPVRLGVDVQGSAGASIQVRLAYDTVPPEVTVQAPPLAWEGAEVTATVTATDDQGEVTLAVTGADGAAVPVGDDGTVVLDTTFGDHEYRVVATDRRGNTTERTVAYRVLRFTAEPPLRRQVQRGSTVPLAVRVESVDGHVAGAAVAVELDGVDAGLALQERGGRYLALWRTSAVDPGERVLGFVVTVDAFDLPAVTREVSVSGGR